MDWVEDEAEHLAPRVEVQPPVVRPVDRVAHLERVLVRPLEAARAEAEAWGPTYRVIRRYPPRTEAWEPEVRVVAEARQQPWARRTKSVREVKRKRWLSSK